MHFSVPRRITAAALAITSSLVLPFAVPVAAQSPAGISPTAVLLTQSLPTTSGFQQALIAATPKEPEIASFYAARNFAPFWTASDPASETRRAELLTALDGAGLHALPQSRYPADELRRAFRSLRSEGDRARLEVRLSQALLEYARDLHSGALEPSKIDAGIVRVLPRPVPAEVLAAFETSPRSYLHSLAPRTAEYARLLRARHHLVALIAEGGYGPQIQAKSLRQGAQGAPVVQLRDRLQKLGYLGRTATNSYDAEISAALRAFQKANGLQDDGAAGEATITALNIPAEERLSAITVALERERWSNIERGQRHIWVNLADFTAQVFDDGKLSFETRAVIGSTMSEKRTPEFSDMMTYMEVNPTWTVPPGIIRRDYLPRLQANPNALGHLEVIDSRGRVVPRGNIDFSRYSARNFPFNLRQPPGPNNALGKVKFMFPNAYAIYLHDSPDRHLFARENRAYSSGCVRLSDPMDFAYTLLAPQTDNPQATFKRALDTKKPTRISLETPVPIHLDYRTAFTDAKGVLQFRKDIYGRDAEIAKALAKAGVDGA